jgi:predicted kinase
MLIILGGLPATGKTTIARLLAARIGAVHLRIDTIEEAIFAARPSQTERGPEGYLVAYGIADDNLKLGLTVIADCVNALNITREAWRSVAVRAARPAVEIEVTCSDAEAHRHRLEAREHGPHKLRWQAIVDRRYDHWEDATMVVDTAVKGAEAIVDDLVEILRIPTR